MDNYMGEHTKSRLIRSLSQERPSVLCVFQPFLPPPQTSHHGGGKMRAWLQSGSYI